MSSCSFEQRKDSTLCTALQYEHRQGWWLKVGNSRCKVRHRQIANLGKGSSADQHTLAGGISGECHPAAICAVLNEQMLFCRPDIMLYPRFRPLSCNVFCRLPKPLLAQVDPTTTCLLLNGIWLRRQVLRTHARTCLRCIGVELLQALCAWPGSELATGCKRTIKGRQDSQGNNRYSNCHSDHGP
jgi:hypothetical protein